jgi:hypothetical protein
MNTEHKETIKKEDNIFAYGFPLTQFSSNINVEKDCA